MNCTDFFTDLMDSYGFCSQSLQVWSTQGWQVCCRPTHFVSFLFYVTDLLQVEVVFSQVVCVNHTPLGTIQVLRNVFFLEI